ncbi:hypothetical protein ZOSMA_31G00490 [Zostera marina]|uniref:Uncharacterized protein n=1 Tax=Zostera marina TaxID=29655 RepID=A0A0K9P8Z7_ZOSMR|nr:hypothetical protein ZOSMA_31G00490 [Zostera marina]
MNRKSGNVIRNKLTREILGK